MVDRRTPVPSATGAVDEAHAGAAAWAPRRGREVPEALASARSPLLRRAFLGAEIADGLPGAERGHHEVDAGPHGLGRGWNTSGCSTAMSSGAIERRTKSTSGHSTQIPTRMLTRMKKKVRIVLMPTAPTKWPD